MALEENMYMPIAPAGNFGGDWGSWIILFLIFGMFNGGMGGFGGGYDFPWLLNGQQGINANTNAGFRDAALSDQITGIQSSINTLTTAAYDNQIASMNQRFADSQNLSNQLNTIALGLQNCCCENRSNIADLKYTVATENCADRQVVSDGVRDILAATQAQTQAILTQMCNDKIEEKNDTINQLRSELLYARGQASQDVQTAAIQAGQRALASEVEQYVAPKAMPAYVVQNPNCCYTCGTNCGCGVG